MSKKSVFPVENKMQQLEEYGLKMTTELEGCVGDMCNISDLLVEESEERGKQEGQEQTAIKNIKVLMRKT